jgi:HSP20 family protein
MPRQEIEVKKQSELLPKSTGGLFSFDEFDNFFDDFMTRKWPRLMDWNVPTLSQANFPRVDIIDHENDIEVKATLPGVKKEDIDVSIINQTITIRASCKEEKRKKKKVNIFDVRLVKVNSSEQYRYLNMLMMRRLKPLLRMAY